MTYWNRWTTVVMCVLVVTIVVLPGSAHAWIAFAKITTSTNVIIDGDATEKGFEKQIAVTGIGNRIERAVSSTGTASGALVKGPLVLVKGFDIATPKLFEAAALAMVLKTVEITIFKTTTTGTNVPGFKIILTDATLTQVDTAYDPGATPSTIEKLEFIYSKIEWRDLLTGTSRIVQ